MTIEEFGRTIKQKYPQYKDINDAELGQKMLAKYPQYSNVVTGTPTQTSQVVQKTGLAKAASVADTIFGGGKIGEAIGAKVGQYLPESMGGARPQDRQFYDTGGPSAREVAGDVANVGFTIAGVSGVGTAGNFTARLLKTIGLGAGLAGTRAISKGADIGEATKSAAIGGVIAGAIPIAGAGLQAIGKQISLLPARFVNSALSRNKSQVLNDIAKDKVDDFANYVVKSKPIGTADKLVNESIDSVQSLSNKINTMLSSSERQVGGKTTIGINNFLDDIAKTPEAEGALLKRVDIQGIVERLAPQTKQLLSKKSLTILEANKLRQLLDKTLGDRAFLGGQLSSDKIILRTFANNLRETVKSKAPQGTRAMFSELANEIRFRDGLLDRIAKKAGNQVLSFGDFIGGGLGGIFGGGLPGAVAGVTARRVIESVPFKIGSAKAISAITKAGPILDSLAPAQQTAILKLFSELLSPTNENSVEQPTNSE